MGAASDLRGDWRAGLSAMLLIVLLIVGAETKVIAQRSQAVSELAPLEAGVTLPVEIDRTLCAGKVKAGTVFEVTTTQRVPVSENAYLNRGAKVRVVVVTSDAGDKETGRPSMLSLRFRELSYRGKTIQLTANAVAIANFVQVDQTFLPTTGGPDRGNMSRASWNTQQVGGDQVNRSGWVGDVSNTQMEKVGSADYYGVYSLPVELDGAMVPLAVGVFSTTAKGLYGFDRGTEMISSGGLTTISNPRRPALIRNRDQMLLEVVASQ
jgi:hypothetical protein